MSDENDSGEKLKRCSSAGAWIMTISVILVIYVISPPFVMKLLGGKSMIFSVIVPSSEFVPAPFRSWYDAIYSPLRLLISIAGQAYWDSPLNQFYRVEARIIGLQWTSL